MTVKILPLINQLKTIGYDLYLEGENLKYKYHALIEPPKDKVMPLLNTLKANKEAVIKELKNHNPLKHCTWLNKDVPSYECFDWCFKANRTPSTCEHFKAWWREREKQLIEAGGFKC
ncbi:MAG: hypothetical protein HY578_00730 [Nitrospinae bacterium]|nr:hypothetical protein [Nitrospinota bacterium]